MISSAVRFLAAAGALSLGALAAPAEAAVFQASASVSLTEIIVAPNIAIPFSLPKYSGPGTIAGVNIALSGSGTGVDRYLYVENEGITVDPYSRTFGLAVVGPPHPSGPQFLDVEATAEYAGGSVLPCPDPECEFVLALFHVSSSEMAFSGSVDLSDFSDYAGGGSNAFLLIENVFGTPDGTFRGSATVTETILAVPEPPTWAMALIGFAIVGFAAHSRRLGGFSRHAVSRTRSFEVTVTTYSLSPTTRRRRPPH